MISEDFLISIESPSSDGLDNGFQYPNLFRHVIADCQHTFASLDLLEKQGFEPVAVNALSDELIDIFRTDELYLNLDVIKNVYVQDLGDYKIMVVLSISLPTIDQSNSLVSNHHPYYILAKVLLNKNDEIVKNHEYGFPSITYYRKEGRFSAKQSSLVLDGYYTFFDNYYSFTDVEEFDAHNTKYCFVFKDYKHNIVATSVHCNSAIELIRLKNSSFYFNGVSYNPAILFEIDESMKVDDLDFIDYLRCRMNMTQDQLDLLAMAMI